MASISTEEDDEQIISEVLELDREYVSGLFDGYSSRFEWKDAVLRQQAGSDVNGSVVVMKNI